MSRVNFVLRVNFGSCRVNPRRVRVAVLFRVQVGEEKNRHGSNTTRTRYVTRIATPTSGSIYAEITEPLIIFASHDGESPTQRETLIYEKFERKMGERKDF